MRRLSRLALPAVLAAALLAAAAPIARAQSGLTVKQKSTIDMGSMGGGELTETVMIHGADRQKRVTEGRMKFFVISRDASATEIVRLDQGQVYRIDAKKKQAQAQSFAEMRKEVEKAQKEMEKAASAPDEKNVRVWVESQGVERTGERRSINGFDTERAVLRLTVMGEDLKTQEKSPLFYLSSDMWIAPGQTEAARIQQAFLSGYVEAMGLDVRGAGNPYARYFKDLYVEMDALEGYPILSTLTVEAPAAEGEAGASANPVGAVLGGLRRRGNRANEEAKPAASAPGRAVVFRTTTEVLSLSTEAPPPSEFELPEGYRVR
jgi:NACalpha-BTF3-like transcription factor